VSCVAARVLVRYISLCDHHLGVDGEEPRQ